MILGLKIENYKSIRSQNVELGKFSIIFGKNGSGKTNFISAIQLLKYLADGSDLDMVLNSRIAPLTMEFFSFHTQDHTNVAHFEIRLLSSKHQTYTFSYEVALSRATGRLVIQREVLKKVVGRKEQTIYRRERDLSFSGAEDAPIPFKTEPGKLMLSSYSNEDVADAIAVIRNCTFVDTALEGKEGITIVQGNRPNLNSIDGVATSLFIKNGGRFEQAVKSIQKIIPGFTAPSVGSLGQGRVLAPGDVQTTEEDTNRYFVTWHDVNTPNMFSYLSLSHGDRRVIHLIFNLFNAEEGSFLSVEEIENGMHYGRIKRLLDEFRTQASNRNIQVLATTHSIEILKDVTIAEVIQCKKGEEGSQFTAARDTKEYELIRGDLERDPTPAELVQSGLLQ
jgi:predicted ATPase